MNSIQNKPAMIALVCAVIAVCIAVVIFTLMPRSYAAATGPDSTSRESGAEAQQLQELQNKQNQEVGSGTEREGTQSR